MTLPLPLGPNLITLPRVSATRRGVGGVSLAPQWPAKDPAAIDFYGADFAWVFDGGPLVSVTAAVSPLGAVDIDEQDLDGTVFVMRLAGGVDGVPATILLTATTSEGQVEPRSITLPIVAQGISVTNEGTMPATITMDATTTLIASIPIRGLFGSAASIEYSVLARNIVTGEACSWRIFAVVENIGTPNVTAGSPSITAYQTPASLAGTNLSVTPAGNVVLIFATGLAGTAISWTPNPLQITVA